MKRKPVPLYPFLFALFPLVSLYSHNINEVNWLELARPAIVLCLVAAGLWGVLALVFRNLQRGAAFASALLVVLFVYADLREVLGVRMANAVHWLVRPGAFTLGMQLVLIVVCLGLILKYKVDSPQATSMLNWVALCFLFVPGITIIPHIHLQQPAKAPQVKWQASAAVKSKPDIYYIIPDAYGRTDILREMYGFDNGEFTRWLEAQGFQVAKESHSNYCQTALSLNSSLRCEYLDDVSREAGVNNTSHAYLYKLLKHTPVVEFLKAQGYRMIGFATGYEPTSMRRFDEYLAPGISMTDFEVLLMKKLPLLTSLYFATGDWAYTEHRKRINFAFDKLPEVAAEPGPKFVFVHLVCPHPPFVFDPEGRPVRPPWHYTLHDANGFHSLAGPNGHEIYRKGYHDQVAYLNRRLQEAIAAILKHSPTPPIIVLQGDHGPGNYLDFDSVEATVVPERFSILNALYLPGPKAPKIPQDLTPVNSFRIILKHYFGVKFKLLSNRSYYATWRHPYQFIDVTDRLNEPIPAQYLYHPATSKGR